MDTKKVVKTDQSQNFDVNYEKELQIFNVNKS